MAFDLLIRGGLVVDGTGSPARLADVAVTGDRVAAIGPKLDGSAHRVIEAEGRLVTPGFVDIHTHLDAQFSWDPRGTSSCWHGVTSTIIGNCGVTFAPCRPEDRRYLAEMMESVEDIPAEAILGSLSWRWETYSQYLADLDALPKGLNVGGMIGHSALRRYAMGDRAEEGDPTDEDLVLMSDLVDDAMGAGAFGFSPVAHCCTPEPTVDRSPARSPGVTSCCTSRRRWPATVEASSRPRPWSARRTRRPMTAPGTRSPCSATSAARAGGR